jgi:uncharacterized damage-inducible protein DinB
MHAVVKPVIGLYALSNGILATSIRDLSDRDAKVRSRGGTGPSIAWTIGHLCHYKLAALGLIDQPRDNAFQARFEHTPATDGADYPPLAELAAAFSQLTADLCTALETASAKLEAPMPGAGPHEEKTVLDSVLFFAWHEAYHLGSIGAIRKELGRPAIAELVAAGGPS